MCSNAKDEKIKNKTLPSEFVWVRHVNQMDQISRSVDVINDPFGYFCAFFDSFILRLFQIELD